MSVVETTILPLPPRERADYWCELVSGTFIPLDVRLHEPVPSAGTIASRSLGPLQISEVEAGPQTVDRSARRIAQGGEEYLTVTLQRRGTARLTQDGRQALVGPGSFTCSDAGRPYLREQPDAFRFTTFRVHKTSLGVSDDDLRAATGTLFDGVSGTSGLVAAFLGRLARQAAGFDPHTGHRLALTASDLLALLVRERRGRLDPRAPEHARGMLTRVQEYVLLHLGDPGLCPERVAAAHHVSVRYLHKLFHAEGTTLGRWVLRERLERCRRELARPGRGVPAVGAVAQRWGFVSPSHFSRAFRAAYGMSPREWQAAARLRPAGGSGDRVGGSPEPVAGA
ncbi:helix-turn-helix domain-containing protein [Streptomyces sp. W1SF4]|uniref:helix-turn-helix domain-containing protein n=1 Tax=Streptomyces sp. W1SF4 TaxID=2305220 RepID=UPI000F6D2D1A|nr:helix-turn-helix domain-containing protein [Streptomyces sp. W1SF4]AZM93821.1 helix-turn-helix domain-containing protein [Streptomyces sp. W1SF4]